MSDKFDAQLNRLLLLSSFALISIGCYAIYNKFIYTPPKQIDKIIDKYGAENIYRTEAYFITDKQALIYDYLQKKEFVSIEKDADFAYTFTEHDLENASVIIQKSNGKSFLYEALKEGVTLDVPANMMWIEDEKGIVQYFQIEEGQDITIIDLEGNEYSFNELTRQSIFDEVPYKAILAKIAEKINAISN